MIGGDIFEKIAVDGATLPVLRVCKYRGGQYRTYRRFCPGICTCSAPVSSAAAQKKSIRGQRQRNLKRAALSRGRSDRNAAAV